MSKHSNEQVKAKKTDEDEEIDVNKATSETRSIKKAEQPNEQKDTTEGKFKLNFRTRKFPIWLRIIVVLILLIVSLLLGLIVGYAFFGDGEVIDALKIETYQHILDIINKE